MHFFSPYSWMNILLLIAESSLNETMNLHTCNPDASRSRWSFIPRLSSLHGVLDSGPLVLEVFPVVSINAYCETSCLFLEYTLENGHSMVQKVHLMDATLIQLKG